MMASYIPPCVVLYKEISSNQDPAYYNESWSDVDRNRSCIM